MHTRPSSEQGDSSESTWSREFLISQIVIAVIIVVTIVLAVMSEDRGLIANPTLPQGNVVPGIGIGSELTDSGTPIDCLDHEELAQDCETLLSIRATLAGDAALEWNEENPVTDWEGVIVGGEPPRVLSLNLTTSELTGIVPPELGELSELRFLYLYGNDLGGEIPTELGRLVHLDTLDLGDNQLTGSIPPELGQLLRLASLDLSANQLTGTVPIQLGDLKSLEWLVISENELTGSIADVLERLPNLEYVSLYGNRFSGCIPSRLRDVDGFPGILPLCESQ